MITSKEISDYLLKNPIDRSSSYPYRKAAEALKVDEEKIRQIWRSMRKRKLVEIFGDLDSQSKKEVLNDISYKEERRADGSVQIQDTVDRRLTDEELFERYGRNSKEWRILSVWFKDKQNGFLLSVHFAPIKIDKDLGLQKEEILKELYQNSPKIEKYTNGSEQGKYLYELTLFDAHFGKMSWGEEVGENYDIKIAEKRFNLAIDELLNRINPSEIERIVFPIGNDLINVDSRKNETTAGTRQDVDSRFYKIIKTVKRILLYNIDKLSQIAPVDVIVVAGNHDNESMFMIGEMLDAYYHNNENVSVDNSPKQRKYYKYGLNGFQYTHGNEEPHQALGLIFATEEPKLWSSTKYRICKIGHFHKTKKINYLSVDEYQGFQIMVLPSLSGTCAWTKSKGYDSIKAAKGFLYDKTKGLQAEYTYSL